HLPHLTLVGLVHGARNQMPEIPIITRRLYQPYMWVTMVAGGLISVYAGSHLDIHSLDFRFGIIFGFTLLFSSRIVIPIPRFNSHISVSDTFIFLTMLLYGGEAATLLAGAEALLSSRRFSKKPATILFNFSCGALSAFITFQVLRAGFGNIVAIHSWPLSPRLIAAVSIMALVQYAANSGLIAICAALKTSQGLWHTWTKYYFWTLITYLVGASAATITAKSADHVGFYAVILTAPTIAIIFLTYRTYQRNIEAAATQTEQADQHIKELSHYIAEQDRIREQFSQMEKLSALGELASGVAHDFNNTLAGILGRAQLLQRTSDPEKIKRGLEIIIKGAEDGANTVKRIQDFARQRRDRDFEPVAIDQILLDVSEITKPRWKDRAEAENVHINLELQIRSHSQVMGDESELRDVLVNMVFNAIDAMPEGGLLTMGVEDVDGSVVVSVSDTGIGMNPEIRSRIFDPFFTTKGKTGMGLGLAVSFGIIRRHEGTIEVVSELKHGSAFRIRLPIAEGVEQAKIESHPNEEITPALAAVPHEDRQQPTILVVDDEEHVRELLRDILESEGCKAYLAADGPAALAIFDTCELDGVFTDVGMPGMSGWELARAIRERNKRIPIAVITGWGDAVGSSTQKEAGVNWVVTKPFTAERITELVESISERQAVTAKRPFLCIVAA
ncbi:MAG: response regulator, partial [bacterium]